MKDFYKLSKDEFLKSYSYLSEKDYDETRKIIDSRITKFNKDEFDNDFEYCWSNCIYLYSYCFNLC